MRVHVQDHPLLAAVGLVSRFPAPLAELPQDPRVAEQLGAADHPVTTRTEERRQAIRAQWLSHQRGRSRAL